MKKTMMLLLGLCLLSEPLRADDQILLKDRKAKESYSLGYEFGAGLMLQGIDTDLDVVLQAIREALQGKKPALAGEEIRDLLRQLRTKTAVSQDRRYRELAAQNRKEGKKFLEENGKKSGIKILPSGLQYRVLREGDGPIPTATDRVKVQYRGTLVNGSEFDSSYSRTEPATVAVNGTIKGWTEALQLMKAGSKWQLYIPAELAYGERQHNRIPPDSTLIFEIELLSIDKEAVPGKAEHQRVMEKG